MKVSNKKLPGLLTGCVLAAISLPANAASSVLDPYFMVPAPKNTQESIENKNPKLKKQRQKAKRLAAKQAREIKEKEEGVLFDAEPPTHDTKFEAPVAKAEKPLTPLKSIPATTTTERKEIQPAPAVKIKAQAPVVKTPSLISSDRPTIKEGLGQIGSGIVITTKATGYDIVAGSKAAAHGAVAVGHGFQWTGSKIASGTVATKDKIANMHSNGFKGTMANAGTAMKEGSAAAGGKLWEGTKWAGHGCQVGAVKTLTGIQWLGEKTGNGLTATKDKCIQLFGSGVSDQELAQNADPTMGVK